MPFYRVPNLGLVHFKIGGKRLHDAPCRAPFEWQHLGTTYHHCCKASAFLCDAPVGDEGKTCDMPICSEHAKQIGPDEHLCPKHAAEAPQKELF
jgi:hypothetical protein